MRTIREILTEANDSKVVTSGGLSSFPADYEKAKSVIDKGELLSLMKGVVPDNLISQAKSFMDGASNQVKFVGFIYDSNRKALFIKEKYNSRFLGVVYTDAQIQ